MAARGQPDIYQSARRRTYINRSKQAINIILIELGSPPYWPARCQSVADAWPTRGQGVAV
eukprot:853506-Lingulodinium_polyedra.AAC.1